MRRAFLTALLSTAIAVPVLTPPAQAQTSEDVLIMRRAVTKADAGPQNEMRPIEGSDLNGFYWVVSNWINGERSCTATATQTRLRGCVYQGKMADEASCPQPAPETERIAEDWRGCEYSWLTEPSGDWAESCALTTRPVSASCLRQTGDIVDDSFCVGQARPTEEKAFNEEGCTYAWAVGQFGAWSSTCSAEARRERLVECQRSDGTDAPEIYCTEPEPASYEIDANYSHCEYNWVPTEWVSESLSCGEEVPQNRTVSCLRDDGQIADESLCVGAKPETSRIAPDYGACSYAWSSGEWGDWNSTCSTQAERRRIVSCRREDGTNVDPENCNPADRPAEKEISENLTGCGYEWRTGDWATTPACSTSSERTRTVTCTRTDGLAVEDTMCAEQTRPAESEIVPDYSSCRYNWKVGAWQWENTCSDSTSATRSVECERSDGTIVDDAQCALSDKPVTAITGPQYSGCVSEWVYGAWSDWSSTCSADAKRTRAVRCSQERPAGTTIVEYDYCTATEPDPSEEISANYSGCEATWKVGVWGWNGIPEEKSSTCSASPTQTRTVECMKTNSSGVQEVVDESLCVQTKPEATQTLSADYEGCEYSWMPGPWSSWDSTCSENAKRTRTTQCVRSDGQTVSTSYCDPTAEGARTEETAKIVTDCGGLLQNGDFEDGTASWRILRADTVSVISDAYAGQNALRLSGASLDQYLTSPIAAGATVNINLWCKKSASYGIYRISLSGDGYRKDNTFNCTGTDYQEIRFTEVIPTHQDSLRVWIFSAYSGPTYGIDIDNIRMTVN